MKQLAVDFGVFWSRYPLKVGKLAAQKAYQKVRASGTTQDELLTGIAAYVAHKPEYADWCHPRTWLHQGRWMDEWERTLPAVQERPFTASELEQARNWSRMTGGGCPHDPPCEDRPACLRRYIRTRLRLEPDRVPA